MVPRVALGGEIVRVDQRRVERMGLARRMVPLAGRIEIAGVQGIAVAEGGGAAVVFDAGGDEMPLDIRESARF